MAIFHLSMTRASRKVGRSAVAMIAYRAGELMRDERTGEIHDYTKKPVLRAELIMPRNAPAWEGTREEFWNASEKAHTRGNAIVAREIELSLPFEATQDQRERMGLEFARHVSDRFNVPVDACFHPPSSKDGDHRNFHMHLLICTRSYDADGFGNVVREMDAIANRQADAMARKLSGETRPLVSVVDELRSEWAGILNRERQREHDGQREFLYDEMDHRSFGRQGIEREPTIKLGRAATDMERRGDVSDRAQMNEDVRQRNGERTHELDRVIERTHNVGPEPDRATEKPRSALDKWLATMEREYEPVREGPETFERTFEP